MKQTSRGPYTYDQLPLHMLGNMVLSMNCPVLKQEVQVLTSEQDWHVAGQAKIEDNWTFNNASE